MFQMLHQFLKNYLVFFQFFGIMISVGTTIWGWISISSRLKKLQRAPQKIALRPKLISLRQETEAMMTLSSAKEIKNGDIHRDFSEQAVVILNSMRSIEEALDDKEILSRCKNITKYLEKFTHVPILRSRVFLFKGSEYTEKELNEIGFNISNDLNRFVTLIEMRIAQSRKEAPNV